MENNWSPLGRVTSILDCQVFLIPENYSWNDKYQHDEEIMIHMENLLSHGGGDSLIEAELQAKPLTQSEMAA